MKLISAHATMDTKIETLYNIYSIVKSNPHPTTSMLQTSELILRQSCPWDEVVKNLNELQSEGYINMNQLSTVLISITAKGLSYINMHLSVYGIS